MTFARGRAGFTLVELMVSMAVMALSFSVVAIALARDSDVGRPESYWEAELRAARSSAIEQARPIVVWPDSAHRVPPVLLLPDGRVVGDPGAAAVQSLPEIRR
jgi:prepilin-type N-terminal cleavage/methylation domain-containing protein